MGGVLTFMFISVTHDVYWGGGWGVGGVLAFMFSSVTHDVSWGRGVGGVGWSVSVHVH